MEKLVEVTEEEIKLTEDEMKAIESELDKLLPEYDHDSKVIFAPGNGQCLGSGRMRR